MPANEDERFARIESLIEEYRISHEDLTAYVQHTCTKAEEGHHRSQHAIREAREQFRRIGKFS